MKHSIKEIAKSYSELSEKRKDEKRFVESDFIKFAYIHKQKYCVIESNNDLLVTTLFSDKLIEDYRNSL